MSKKSFAAVLSVAFAIAVCIIFCIETAFAQEEKFESLNGVKICIDAGHGGYDIGTQGKTTKTPESDINLDIAKKAKAIFEKSGAEVLMTRENSFALAGRKDEDMQKRSEIIKNANCDIMISIHQNMYEDSCVRGPQVFYLIGAKKSENLANCVQEALSLASGISRKAIAADLFILKSGAQPSIIAECGFLSNESDEKLLLDEEYKTKIAQAIVKGTAQYFKSVKGGNIN